MAGELTREVLPSAGTNLCLYECLVKLIELKKKKQPVVQTLLLRWNMDRNAICVTNTADLALELQSLHLINT